MMELHVFRPAFGLPDPSPFCIKAMILMEMAGQPYRKVPGNLRRAPKGKLPVLRDKGEAIPDSSFIRFHLERTYGVDFDEGLNAEQRGIAWSVEKMLEDHLYWLIVRDRWLEPANFDRGPRHFFDAVPAPLRPLVVAMIKRKVGRSLQSQGIGRHSVVERRLLADRATQSLSAILGEKLYLTGDTPCGADATFGAFMIAGLCPLFESRARQAIEHHANLVAYAARMQERYFPHRAVAAT